MYAVIDIGTNSVRLLVAKCENGTIVPLSKDLITTRLGEGIATNPNLRSGAMERTAAAVEQFVKKARAVRAGEIFIFGTSALRDAPNREAFSQYLWELCGLRPEIISGDAEAQIGYTGAFGENQVGIGCMIDVGGGSTELTAGENGKIESAVSVPVGAVRLRDICLDGVKRISAEDRLRMEKFIEERTFRFLSVPCRTKVLTGVSGTATSLASIDKKMIKYVAGELEGYELSYGRVAEITEMLLEMSLEEKRKLKGLMPQRADIIAGGAMVIEHVMRTRGFEKMVISEKDNLEGFLLWKLSK